MNSFEMNKIVGAVLAAALFVTATRLLADALYAPEAPPHVASQTTAAATPAGGAVEVVSLAARLAGASVKRGEKIARKCVACHTFKESGKNKIGPNLWEIVGRQKATHGGFSYSGALKGLGGAWDYDALDAFLTKPRAYAKGTSMSFAGLRKPKDRADLLAYLRGLAARPTPLP